MDTGRILVDPGRVQVDPGRVQVDTGRVQEGSRSSWKHQFQSVLTLLVQTLPAVLNRWRQGEAVCWH